MNPPASALDSPAPPVRRRLGLLGIAAVGLFLSGAFHLQSAGLTGTEVLIGGGLALLTALGALSLMVTGSRPPQAVRWAGAYLLWGVANVIIAVAAGIPLSDWVRFAFPALVFPGFMMLGWGHFRSPERRAGLLLALAAVAATFVLLRMSLLQNVVVSAVRDPSLLRGLGGEYYSVFTTVLALPLLVSAAGRLVAPWPVSLALLSIGIPGIVLTFTRTYWVATAASTVLLVALLARERKGDLGRATLALVILVLLISSLLAALPGNLAVFALDRLTGLANIGEVGSLQYRLAESAAVMATALEHPVSLLVGNGFGARYAYEWVNPVSGLPEGGLHLQYVHNYFVYILFAAGAVGLSLFAIVWYFVARALLRRSRRQAPATVVLRLAVLTAGANVLLSSLSTPRFLDYHWAAAFGLLLGAALDEAPPDRRSHLNAPAPEPPAPVAATAE
jgi:hypothetical protein